MADKKSSITDLVNSVMRRKNDNKQPFTSSIMKQIEYDDHGSNFIANFKMKPAELMHYLNRHVVKQDKAISTLSAKICGHFNAIRLRLQNGEKPMEDVNRIKSNILLIGSTGVGKTLLLKMIAKKIGVPFVKVDVTKHSEAGYVGEDVEDIIRTLVAKTRDVLGFVDASLAQYGIVFIDEIDKIASRGGYGPDVSRSGVQQALLSIIEEVDIPILPKSARNNMVDPLITKKGLVQNRDIINTRNILFIFAGAFPGLEEIIKKRMGDKTMGFLAEIREKISSADILSRVETADLEKFGMMPEFIGRIPVRVVLENLEEADLFEILRKEHSPIVTQFKEIMASYGIEVEIEEDVLRYIAKKAIAEKTGARGLLSAFNSALGIYESELPNLKIPFMCFTLPMVDGTIDQMTFLEELKSKFIEIEASAEEVTILTPMEIKEGEVIDSTGWLGDPKAPIE